jgi:hypothetical protein
MVSTRSRQNVVSTYIYCLPYSTTHQILYSAVTLHIRVHALSRECCTRFCERQSLDVQFNNCDTVGNKKKGCLLRRQP